MKRFLKRFLIGLLILIVLLACLIYFLIGTTSGLSVLTGQLNRWQPAGISMESASGRVLGPLSVNGFKREAEDGTITVQSLNLDWQSPSPWRRVLQVSSAKIDGVRVSLIPQDKPDIVEPESEPFKLPESLSLPLDINIDELLVTDVSVKTNPDADPLVFDSIAASAHYSREEEADVSMAVVSDWLSLNTSIDAQTQGRFPVAGNADWTLSWDELAPIAGNIELSGDLDELNIKPVVEAPYGVELNATISNALDDLSVNMVGSVQSADLSVIKADLPPIGVNADINFAGSPLNAKATSVLTVVGLLPDDLKLNFNARLEEQLLLIDALQVNIDNQTLAVASSGSVDLSGAQPNVDLIAEWRDVQWPFDAEPMLTSQSGSLIAKGPIDNFTASLQTFVGEQGQVTGDVSLNDQNIGVDLQWQDLSWPLDGSQVSEAAGSLLLNGTLDDYGLSLNSTNEVVGAGPVTLKAAGVGSDKHVSLPMIKGTALSGDFSGRAKVNLEPALSMSVNLAGAGINPEGLSAELPGKLAFDVSVAGETVGESLNIAVKKLNVDGTLRGLPLEVRGVVNTEANRIAIENFSVNSGPSSLLVDGIIDEQIALSWTLDSPDLSGFYSGASGRIKSAGNINGDLSLPAISGNIDASNLKFEGTSIKSVKAVADVDPSASGNINVDIAVVDVVASGFELSSFTSKATGQVDRHNITLAGRSNQGDVDLEINGGFKQPIWDFTIDGLTLAPPDFAPWSLSQPAKGRVKNDEIDLTGLCLQSGSANLCSDVQRTNALLKASYALNEFPLSYVRDLIPEGLFVDGAINSKGQWQAPTGGNPSAQLNTSLNGINLQVLNPDEQKVSVLAMQPSEINVNLNASGMDSKLILDLGRQGRLDGNLSAKGSLDKLATGPISGELTGEISDFDFLVALVPDIESIAGRLRSDLRVSGTATKPIIGGALSFENGALKLATPGLDLKDIAATISAKGGTVLNLVADAASGDGQINVKGTVDLADEKPEISVAINGRDFTVLDTLDAKAALSPQLDVLVRADRVFFNGNVDVPLLEITPKEIPAGVVLANEDQVIVTQVVEEEAVAPVPVKGTINLSLGDNVRVDAFGLKAKLSGKLRITEAPGAETTATGTLAIETGTFKAYGQNLQVENGKILYAGGPISQPGFDIEAVRKVTSELQVGVRARGAIEKPQFSLFSTPPMTESEQMSYLVLGRPLEDNSPSENSAVRQAAMALGVAGGKLLTEKFGNRLGLDSVAIGSELRETGEQAALVVGKYLSPRLFVSYGVGLFEPVSTLRLNYSINRNVKLVSETTESRSGGDIVFTFESDK